MFPLIIKPHLSLDGIEVLDVHAACVNTLEDCVSESTHWQRLQVQQLSWGRVLLRQDQVPEAHRQNVLTPKPLVRDNLDKNTTQKVRKSR